MRTHGRSVRGPVVFSFMHPLVFWAISCQQCTDSRIMLCRRRHRRRHHKNKIWCVVGGEIHRVCPKCYKRLRFFFLAADCGISFLYLNLESSYTEHTYFAGSMQPVFFFPPFDIVIYKIFSEEEPPKRFLCFL